MRIAPDAGWKIAPVLVVALLAAACTDSGGSGGGGGGGNAGASAQNTVQGSSQLDVSWAPASGPVAGYAVFVQRNGGDVNRETNVSSARVTLSGEPGDTASVAVAAFDAAGRLGPLSEVSNSFVFPADVSDSQATVLSQASAQAVAPPGDPAAGESGASDPGAQNLDTQGGGADGAEAAEASEEIPPIPAERLSGAFLWSSGDTFRVTDATHETLRVTAAPANAQWVGSGDLDGDGAADLLWSDGAVLFYTPLAHSDALAFGQLETGDAVVGVGDFDADGAADLLLRDVNGALLAWTSSAGETGQSLGLQGDAELVAVADFDGDGSDDLVWQSPEGALALWWIANATTRGAIDLELPPGLQVAAAGDFDGDGVDDLVLRDPAGGVMHHRPATGQLEAAGAADPARWRPVGAADLDSDGRDELVWVAGDALRIDSALAVSEEPLDADSAWQLHSLLP